MERHPFYLGGEWRTSDRGIEVVNPYTGRPVWEVSRAGEAEIEEAIGAAVSAAPRMRALHAYERAEILEAVAAGVKERREELARAMTAETGKPISFARVEAERTAFTFTAAAGEAKRLDGEVISLDLAPHAAGRTGILRRFPLGPIAAITPFNFPLNLVAHKLAPAIAAGNSVVLKPSSAAPRTALLLAGIIASAKLPAGALNVLPCSSDEAGQLVSDERLRLITFTGSPVVGWDLKARAGRKRVTLELGGNAAVIVDEGIDWKGAVKRIALGAYGHAGQSCIAVQRVMVHASVFEPFLAELVAVSRSTPVGDPWLEETVVGPMIDEESAAKVEGWIREAVAAGAVLHCGGTRERALMQPTVLTNVRSSMSVCANEVFAPVVTVEPFGTIAEAFSMVNDSRYGLQAGIFTNNLEHAFRAYDVLEVGGVILNDYPTFRIDHMPYGGVKESGFGREGLRYAIEEMTEPKLLVLKPGL
jgi:glyceraldehyde-3-phosphate dehydrogenase (NADP+)